MDEVKVIGDAQVALISAPIDKIVVDIPEILIVDGDADTQNWVSYFSQHLHLLPDGGVCSATISVNADGVVSSGRTIQ